MTNIHGGRDADRGLGESEELLTEGTGEAGEWDEEKDRGNANVNFRGEKRSNQTHDPDAKLEREGDQIELQREPIGGKL